MTSIDPAGSSVSGNDPKDNMRGSSARVSQFSYARVTACIAIVLLHCVNSARVYHAESISAGEKAAAFAACSALMWAVPVFLMVTGALLLDPARKLGAAKLLKYIKRVAIALVIFTIIFTLIKHEPGSGFGGLAKEFFDGLLFNHCMAYLWYLYLMIALYLLMPLFKLMTERLSRGQLRAAAAAAMLIASVLPLGTYAGIEACRYIPTQIIYAVYLFIGRWLYERKTGRSGAGGVTVLSAAVFIVTTAVLPFITYRLMNAGIDPSGLTGYNSPLVILQSAAAFSLIMSIRSEAGSLIESIDRCTFGIYLIHMIFVRLVMKELGVNPFMFGPFGFAGMTIVFFLASYGVTLLVKRYSPVDFL